MATAKKQKTDYWVEEGRRSMESIRSAEEKKKALSILEKKDEFPKELRGILEKYQRKQIRTANDTSDFLSAIEDRLLDLLVKDIYREDFQWSPFEIETAMQFFPAVLPYGFRAPTDQFIQDHRKKLAILEKKDELPMELRRTIETFRGNPATTTSNVARDFLDALENRLLDIFLEDTETTDCQWDPHEFETALRFFPDVLSYDFCEDEALEADLPCVACAPICLLVQWNRPLCPKKFALIPIFVKLADEFDSFEREYFGGLQLCVNSSKHMTVMDGICMVSDEKACSSVLKDLWNIGVLNCCSKGQVERLLCRMTSHSYDDLKKNFRCRFRYLAKLNYASSWVDFWFEFYVCRTGLYFILDTEMVHVLDKLGHLFTEPPSKFWSEDCTNKTWSSRSPMYKRLCKQMPVHIVDEIFLELLEEHITEATAQTRMKMVVFAASNKNVPLKFLYHLLRREPHICNRSAID